MNNRNSQAAVATSLVMSQNAANTAAATSGWVDVRQYEGDLLFVQKVGALTGSIAGAIQDATDNSGTGAAAMTPNEGAFTSVSSANSTQKRTIDAKSTRGFVRYVGTITTGPAQVDVTMLSVPKNP